MQHHITPRSHSPAPVTPTTTTTTASAPTVQPFSSSIMPDETAPTAVVSALATNPTYHSTVPIPNPSQQHLPAPQRPPIEYPLLHQQPPSHQVSNLPNNNPLYPNTSRMLALTHQQPPPSTSPSLHQPATEKRDVDIDIPQQYPSGSPTLPVGSAIGGADGGLVSACRTLVMVAAAGGYTILSAEFERTVLWRSRQRVETTSATWHAANGYLSLLSRNPGEQTLRYNLNTFGRCVDLLGYRARSFGIGHSTMPHVKLIWRPTPSTTTPPPGTFSAPDIFNPHQTETTSVDVNAPTVIVVHREERALAAPRASQPDTLSYLLPRNIRGWQPPASIPSPHPQPAVSMGTLATAPAPVTGISVQQHQQQQYTAHPSQQPNPMEAFPTVYSSALSLPPMRGAATSTLPPVRELAGATSGAGVSAPTVPQPHDPQTTSMMAYAFPGNTAHQVKQESIFTESMTQAFIPHGTQWPPAAPTAHTTATGARVPATGVISPQHGWKETRRSRSAATQMRSCTNCGTRQTRQWVRGERSAWLCHSCGQFWRKNGVHRPAQLWNRPTFKRSRRKRAEPASTSTGSNSRASTARTNPAPATAASAPTPGQPTAPLASQSAPPPIVSPLLPSVVRPSTSVTMPGVEPLFRDGGSADNIAGAGGADA